jgi:hypothetical protein
LSWKGLKTAVLTDPTDITLTYKKPGQVGVTTVALGALTHPSTGNYYFDVLADTTGTWHYRFVSTGTAAGAEEGAFAVSPLETV